MCSVTIPRKSNPLSSVVLHTAIVGQASVMPLSPTAPYHPSGAIGATYAAITTTVLSCPNLISWKGTQLSTLAGASGLQMCMWLKIPAGHPANSRFVTLGRLAHCDGVDACGNGAFGIMLAGSALSIDDACVTGMAGGPTMIFDRWIHVCAGADATNRLFYVHVSSRRDRTHA